VGLLAGGVAHDFNNLLTVILASASLARREDQPADVQAELDAIEEAGTRGAQLTRQLLAVSRTQPLESRTVDVNARIGELTTMLRRLLPETIAIEHLSHTPHALVRGDPTQIDQVLMNLCINARDAMPHGGRLTLETELADIEQAYVAMHPRARPGRYVLITVTDTGTGMAPEVVDRIFEPFFTTKSERAGTGLGLAVAYGVVVQHGGMLHCYSEPGVGTTFRIYLPLQDQAETEPVVPRNQLEIGGSERILVAEDDPAIRAALERVLERAGYVATIVAHGDAACEAVDAAAYDLVLLDVVMPGRSCADTLAHIRKARPDARVLLSSGYTADTNVADLLRDGKTAFLRKPYDPPALLRAIRGALER
jgi:two-component system cell cycle sensor histidine kinase/response regulator CckA